MPLSLLPSLYLIQPTSLDYESKVLDKNLQDHNREVDLIRKLEGYRVRLTSDLWCNKYEHRLE